MQNQSTINAVNTQNTAQNAANPAPAASKAQSTLEIYKQNIIKGWQKRVDERILEPQNYEVLVKLITNAQSQVEADAINTLGTYYKRTGFHFDVRLEKDDKTKIYYLKRLENLSFKATHADENAKNSQNFTKGGAQNAKNSHSPLTHTLIIGDNYPALQNLLISYQGKIKVIYIDPPYGKDDMGEFADTNYENAITRDNLLSMLKPRLELAKMLLKDDGVIFCSIDDRNQAYLKCLFDEVFKEKNFICSFVWEKTQHFGRQKLNYYSNHEYVLCYAKSLYDNEKQQRFLVENIQTEFDDAPLYNASNNKHTMTFPVNSCTFNIKDGVYEKSDEQDKYELLNPVIVENGTNANEFQISFKSRWSDKTLQDELAKGAKVLIKSAKFSPRMIYADNKEFIVSPKSLIFTNEKNPFCAKFKNIKVGTNENGSAEISSILGESVFEYPKPTSLLAYLVGISTTANSGDNERERERGNSATSNSAHSVNLNANSQENSQNLSQNSQNNNFADAKSTHPQTPSAREGALPLANSTPQGALSVTPLAREALNSANSTTQGEGVSFVENFPPKFREFIDTKYGEKFSPEQILGYIYAVLYHRGYREKFLDFLKIDFPKIPFVADKTQFLKLSALGSELVNLHCLKATNLDANIGKNALKGKTKSTIECANYLEGSQELFVNESLYFRNVSRAVWDYKIDKFQVLKSYLDEHKSEQIDYAHFERVIKTLHKSLQIEAQIAQIELV